ncbi:MAG: MlaD family protein [Rhodococcus sp. (in: high G+C Gram-positive bacteria)]|uniref:MlaD family protein n=1 Tax=Rhodococcus sp. TaxID=1831 RepID=UPI003BB1624A
MLARRWIERFDFGPEEANPRTQLLWAIVAIVVITLVLGIVVSVYTRPPGYSSYHLELPESGGLAAGDDVRIAGVPVGKIEALHLAEDHVDVEFTVGSTHRLGDQTSVSVRMLTPIGGLYLAVHPDGQKPLDGGIPAERATLPFLVNDLFEDADAVVEELDTEALRMALTRTASTLADSPEAIRSTVTDLETVVTVFAQQKDQIEDLVALSNEYLRTANDNQDLAVEIIRGYSVLGPQIIAAQDNVQTFADKIAALTGLLFDFLSGPYAEKIEPLLPPLEDTREASGELLESVDSVMTSMTSTLTGLAAIAGPEGQMLIDQSGLTVQRPDVCLPMPGTRC